MNWHKTEVAEDGTHHTLNKHPLYERRFDRVLPFHEPGLAPVREQDKAWHITAEGIDAYPARFSNTFGFYFDRAAVSDESGWYHIHLDGSPLQEDRYNWCGNFQQKLCTVRDTDGKYFHIDLQGRKIYEYRWTYAGDYHEGAAVVTRLDGMQTHIDRNGNSIHGHWLLGTGVYHKGFAIARDQEGWYHVDFSGEALYENRFKMVEPFYNGQALVRDQRGQLIINQAGSMIRRLTKR
ncbi:methyltransferase [bacterium]|nr:methyltransferase [bacterium]